MFTPSVIPRVLGISRTIRRLSSARRSTSLLRLRSSVSRSSRSFRAAIGGPTSSLRYDKPQRLIDFATVEYDLLQSRCHLEGFLVLPDVSPNCETSGPCVHRSLDLAEEGFIGRGLRSARHEDFDQSSRFDCPAEGFRRSRVLYLDRVSSDLEARSGGVGDSFRTGVILHSLTSRIHPGHSRNSVIA